MDLPRGFSFSGIAAGIKPSGKKDLALIVSDRDAVAGGVYTQNVIRAASIDYNRAITPTDGLRGIVVNSGNANACTGAQGIADNLAMATALATHMQARSQQVAVLSTGVIGRPLPIAKIVVGIELAYKHLGQQTGQFEDASTAILTTDQGPKTKRLTLKLEAHEIRIAAMAKGAGMIGPNMATMLAVLTTDAFLSADEVQPMLHRIADKSFNCISVEGHTSTNDGLILMANGAAVSDRQRLAAEELEHLETELTKLAIELAKQIPADGEGATHLIQIDIAGAPDNQSADRIARAIANSPLVKTAVLGGDPNWGRIVSAAGYCGVPLVAEEISLRLNGHELFRAGTPVPFDAKQVSQSIKDSFETVIELTVGTGAGRKTHWTSDLTVDYVRFNSEYTT